MNSRKNGQTAGKTWPWGGQGDKALLKGWVIALVKGVLGAKDLSSFLQRPYNTWIFKLLPGWLSRVYLGILGAVFFRLKSSERKAIKASLSRCLGYRAQPGQEGSWPKIRAGIVDHYHEKLYLAFKGFGTIQKACLKRVGIYNQEILDKALAQGRGVILVTGHYGALEFLPGALAFRDYPLTAMVHCKTPRLKAVLEDRAARANTKLLDPKSGEVFFQALDHLKQGRVLLTQCDEIDMWRPYRDKSVDFLGLNVPLDRSMDILARKSKAVVIMGLVHRMGRGRYVLELIDPAAQPIARGEKLVSARCLKVLSQYIYARPFEWYEWKKLKSFVDADLGLHADENCSFERISDSVAVQLAGLPQPG